MRELKGRYDSELLSEEHRIERDARKGGMHLNEERTQGRYVISRQPWTYEVHDNTLIFYTINPDGHVQVQNCGLSEAHLPSLILAMSHVDRQLALKISHKEKAKYDKTAPQ